MPVTRRPTLPLPPVPATLLVALVLRWWLPGSALSLVATIALGLAGWHLLVRAKATQPERAAALLLLPGVLLANHGLSVAASLMALAAALDRKHREMLLWCGIAIGIDMTAAMIAPLVLALALQRRVPLRCWPIAPLALGVTLAIVQWIAPATISARDPTLSYGAPNVWAIAQDLPGLATLPLIGLAISAVTGACAAYAAWFSARPLHGRGVLEASLLGLLAIGGLLPHADAHALMLADVIAVVLALTGETRRHYVVALLVLGGSSLALGGVPIAGAVLILVATFVQARAVLAPAANDNPMMARAA